jgi:uncharacterized protein YyaL (SSP411 family)
MNTASIQAYAKNIKFLLAKKTGRKYLFSEINKWIYLESYIQRANDDTRWKALQEAIDWLCHSQDQMEDDGFGTYYLLDGFTTSYPETSGYIVPTLLQFAEKYNRPDIRERAKKTLDWLLTIQKPSGGWQSGYVHQNKSEVVFNTGQVIRGMVAGYQTFADKQYLQSAERAADWLVHIQNSNGSFDMHVYLNQARVYDSYVVAPVLELNTIVNKPEFVQMARKNINWILDQNQAENGWFANCDNTMHGNSKPILHTIAYTIDGILDCGILLGEERYIAAAQKPADKLLHLFLSNGLLNGRYDKNWHGTEDFITTGGAQMAIVWHKLYQHTKKNKYCEGHFKMTTALSAIQQRHIAEPKETKGALFGSFPFWGRYERFGCPNWATKYFADALMR